MRAPKSLVLLSAVLVVAACEAQKDSEYYGTGPVTLSYTVAQGFQKYLALPTTSKYFALSMDGNAYYASYCRDYVCTDSSLQEMIWRCEHNNPYFSGGTCRIYAEGNEVVWRGPVTAPSLDDTAARDQVVATGSKYYDERTLSAEWEGYAQPVKGVVILYPVRHRGSVLVELPGDEGTCSGDFVESGEGGTWSISCPNGVDASGAYKDAGKGKGATGTGTDTRGRKIRFTVAGK